MWTLEARGNGGKVVIQAIWELQVSVMVAARAVQACGAQNNTNFVDLTMTSLKILCASVLLVLPTNNDRVISKSGEINVRKRREAMVLEMATRRTSKVIKQSRKLIARLLQTLRCIGVL